MQVLSDSPIQRAIAEMQRLLADQPACGQAEGCRSRCESRQCESRCEAIERIIHRLRLAAHGEAEFCDVRLPLRT
ncbi:MAG TPA: hypothetical protein VK943_01075 [Arenibaculum sp.]|nr:hypothetical protein [Arenibaculum sp.]